MDDVVKRSWEIVRQVRAGEKISSSDIRFAEKCILVVDNELVLANVCEAIICGESPDSLRRLALNSLAALCEKVSEENWVVTILHTINYIEIFEIMSYPDFERFSFFCSLSPRWEVRCNSIPIIAKFHKMGNLKATELLQMLTKDCNKYVKENASNYL